MGSDLTRLLLTLLMIAGGITVFILVVMYVAVPVFRGVGAVIGATFRGIGWLFTHIFEFIGGVLSNLLRFVGSLLVMAVLLPLVPLNIVIGRWSAASHFAQRFKAECVIAATCVYRAVLHHPLKLVLLDGMLEGLEQRVPEAMHGAPGADAPSRRTGQFDGYTIVGSLRAGGSGAKLYVAQPEPEKRRKIRHMPDRVVIKSFTLTEGSSLPQIVRESRALECAKQLGHVLDHGMDEHRFYYVMPYHPGDHLGIITRQLHGECGGRGLDQKRLNLVMSYTSDLLATLSAYHKGGLWHKDVKPENVIVHDGRAHLVDLGLVTALRSAMTLTTHGTEYFRDPEMVRQALRGVKVHQVDGAKFDIYAAGAVLYFMIENTFPAHGGLSRFVASSPEALRWIVRRAMTEYNQRYSTADQMLADLQYVAGFSDAFAVKPAELPSMRGSEAVPLESVAAATVFSSAGSPQPPREGVSGFGFAGGIGGPAGPWAQVGRFNVDEHGNPLPVRTESDALKSRRPKLSITNWWTGRYKPEQDEASAGAPNDFATRAREFRKQAFAFRQEAADFQRQAGAGMMSARKAAREQIKAARERARQMRARALTRRHQTVQPRIYPSTIIIGVLSVLFLGGIISMSILARSNSSARHYAQDAGRPLLLLVDAANPMHPKVREQVDKAVAERRRQGFDVILDGQDHNGHLCHLVQKWQKDQNSEADGALESEFEARNLYGFLYLEFDSDKRNRVKQVQNMLIHSTRPGSTQRRNLAHAIPPAPAQPFLLINDHPAKTDPMVAAKIEERLRAYRTKGWNIQTRDDIEPQVRALLPSGRSQALHGLLAQAHLGGIMRIEARPGDAPAHERIEFSLIERDQSIAPVAADEPDEPSSMSDQDQTMARND